MLAVFPSTKVLACHLLQQIPIHSSSFRSKSRTVYLSKGRSSSSETNNGVGLYMSHYLLQVLGMWDVWAIVSCYNLLVRGQLIAPLFVHYSLGIHHPYLLQKIGDSLGECVLQWISVASIYLVIMIASQAHPFAKIFRISLLSKEDCPREITVSFVFPIR